MELLTKKKRKYTYTELRPYTKKQSRRGEIILKEKLYGKDLTGIKLICITDN